MPVCATNRKLWDYVSEEVKKSVYDGSFDRRYFVEMEQTLPENMGQAWVLSFNFFYEPFQEEGNLGYASIQIYPHDERIMWNTFYPLENIPECTGLGIATKAHDSVLMGLEMLKIPDYYSMGHVSVSDTREMHLFKRKIDWIRKYTFADYKKRSLEYSEQKRGELGGLEITCRNIHLPACSFQER